MLMLMPLRFSYRHSPIPMLFRQIADAADYARLLLYFQLLISPGCAGCRF